MKLEKNVLEWSVFAASVVVVLACLALLVVDISRTGERPPTIGLTVGEPEQTERGFRVPVEVRNVGDQTAADLHAEVVMEADGAEVERSEFTIAFVPRKSSRTGWVVFERDPRCCRLTARTLGYERP